MAPSPSWLKENGLQQLFAATAAAGGEVRAVGGCVRDHLLGLRGGDVDLACSLKPETVMQIAQAQGFKAVPTGIAHGTVTLVLPERAIEVTTLRRDVKTDGRHAEVAFTDRFEEDAARRDFTINALYMDAHGAISDFFGGQEDLAARRIRFIGDAGTRIREDALRILRFFRFLATHGQPPADELAIAACSSARPMLDSLSGERIQQEMKKLLAASDPSYALAQMAVMAIGETLCKANWQVHLLRPLLSQEAQHKFPPLPWLRLLVLVAPAARMEVAAHVSERWKLSRADTQLLEFLTAPPPLDTSAAIKEALRYYKRDWILQALLLQAVDDTKFLADKLLPVARSWEPPVFPVTARDLMARGMSEGKELGDTLRRLEQKWVESDYRLKKEELL